MSAFLFRIAALAAIALTAACASSRSLDDSLSDIAGNAELKGVLFTDRAHDYSDVDITLFEGRLMLTGTMRTETGRAKLIENAWKADGVDQVIDEIFIGDRTSFGQGLADTRIDQTLKAKFIANDDVVSSRYKVAVSGGAIYLIGVARTDAELKEAVELAREIGGVKKVVSHVTVRAPIDAL
ncbi:MAG: BON domain-containing protein [Pseudomonadota bacterium]